MELTSTDIFGVHILEPVCAFTDYLIGLLCFYIFYRLQNIRSNTESINLWSYFFLVMGISTCIGGTTHGFKTYMSEPVYWILWVLTQFLIYLSLYFSERGTIKSEFKDSTVLKVFALLKLVFFCFLVYKIRHFKISSLATALALVPIMIIYYIRYLKTNRPVRLISLGILVSFLTAVVFQLKISIDKWFNFKDLSHIIIMISLWVMYLGVRSLNLNEIRTDKVDFN